MNALLSFLLLTGDSALWLGAAAGILSVFTGVGDMLTAAPLMGLGCLTARLLREHRLLRWAGLLPGAAALLLCGGAGDLLLVLPCLAYLGMCIFKGRTLPDPDEMSYRFAGCTSAAGAGAVICTARGLPWGFAACLLYLGIALFLRRMLRMPAENRSRRLAGLELGVLGLFMAACFGISRRIWLDGAVLLLSVLYRWLIYPLLLLIVYLIGGIVWVIGWLARMVLGDGAVGEIPMPQMGAGMGELIAAEESTASVNPLLIALLRCLGAGLVLLAAYFVFRRLFSAASAAGAVREERDVRKPVSDGSPAERRLRFLYRSPEASVRRAYGEYCRALVRSGIPIPPSDTTLDISGRASGAVDPEEETALRALYLRARYTEHGGLTRADASEAARLAGRLKHSLAAGEVNKEHG